MTHVSKNPGHNALDFEHIEAAMRRARLIRSQTVVTAANRLWLGLKRAASIRPTSMVRAIRPLALVLRRPASGAHASRPVTAAELRAVFGAPANAVGPTWRKSA